MNPECPACRPRPDNEAICEDCKRVLARGIHVAIFMVMEAGFGVVITVTVVGRNYVALGLFVFAAIISTVLAIKDSDG